MSPSLYGSVAEEALFWYETVTLLCLRRLLAVSRCDASLVMKNAGRRIYGAWGKPGSVKCSPEWQLYMTARSVHRRVNNEVENVRYSASTAKGLLAAFPMSAARANSRDDALAHVLPVRASRARHEEPLTYKIIL